MKGSDAVSRDELREHMTATYLNLRIGLALIALVFPIALWQGGSLFLGIGLLPSISDYYYTPLRNIFVGTLCAVGVGLYLYKGFRNRENYALNIAGVLVIAVALFPTQPPGAPSSLLSVHGSSAITFFLAIAYVCLFRAADTLRLIRKPERSRMYARTYKVLGIFMVASPILAYIVSVFQDPGTLTSYVFLLEWFGVWVFASYWGIKSLEMKETHAEQLALAGQLLAGPEGKVQAVPEAQPLPGPARAEPPAAEKPGV